MLGNSRLAPRFIKAKTEEELQRKILILQIYSSRHYKFITIYPVKGGVVGWYYDELDYQQKMKILSKPLEGDL